MLSFYNLRLSLFFLRVLVCLFGLGSVCLLARECIAHQQANKTEDLDRCTRGSATLLAPSSLTRDANAEGSNTTLLQGPLLLFVSHLNSLGQGQITKEERAREAAQGTKIPKSFNACVCACEDRNLFLKALTTVCCSLDPKPPSSSSRKQGMYRKKKYPHGGSRYRSAPTLPPL